MINSPVKIAVQDLREQLCRLGNQRDLLVALTSEVFREAQVSVENVLDIKGRQEFFSAYYETLKILNEYSRKILLASSTLTHDSAFAALNNSPAPLVPACIHRSQTHFDAYPPEPVALAVPQALGVKLGERIPVKVSALHNGPAEFWLQYCPQEARKLHERMQLLYRECKEKMTQVEIGINCADFDTDSGNWYRALVNSTNDLTSVAEVLHVDTGITRSVPIDNLAPLVDELRRMPCQAVKCCLDRVKPFQGQDWNKICENFLRSKHKHHFEAVFNSLSGSIYKVDMYVLIVSNGQEDWISVADCLDWKIIVPCERNMETSNVVPSAPNALSIYEMPIILPPVLPNENTFKVKITYILSPDEFYVIPESAWEKEKALSDEMPSYYNRQIKKAGVEDVMINSFWAWKRTKQFYRARVINVESRNKINVCSVDYGNRSTVTIDDLQVLQPQFCRCPALALRCSLEDIEPVGDEWIEDAVELFDRCTGEDMTAVVITNEGTLDYETKIAVELIDSSGINIGSILKEKKFAKSKNIPTFVHKSPSPCHIPEAVFPNWNPMADDYHGELNSYKVDTDDPGVATTGRPGKEEQICNFYRKRGCCRNIACKYLHVEQPQTEFLEKEEAFIVSEDLQLPKVGEEYLVHISAVISPVSFYVVFPYDIFPIHQLDDNKVMLSEFELLVSGMQDYYEKKMFNENRLYHKAPGQFVVCFSETYKMWLRAMFKGQSPNNSEEGEVFYPDFGDCEYVPMKNIRDITAQFLRVPLQAKKCRIDGIEPNGGLSHSWSKEALRAFMKHCTEKPILMEVKHIFRDVLHVELKILMSEDKILNISDLLVQIGYAQKITRKMTLIPIPEGVSMLPG